MKQGCFFTYGNKSHSEGRMVLLFLYFQKHTSKINYVARLIVCYIRQGQFSYFFVPA